MRRLSPFVVFAIGVAFGAGGGSLFAQARRGGVARERANPHGLASPQGYTHVVAVRGGKTAYIAGQVALDAKGQLVGKGDLKTQTRQAFENLKLALAATGATFQDVVKLTTYVVGYRPADAALIREVRSEYLGPVATPASTLVGVQALAREGFLVEVEAIAVVD
jgi:enamine deaminase RidA (YjgF/YER057c/UK114 family)